MSHAFVWMMKEPSFAFSSAKYDFSLDVAWWIKDASGLIWLLIKIQNTRLLSDEIYNNIINSTHTADSCQYRK